MNWILSHGDGNSWRLFWNRRNRIIGIASLRFEYGLTNLSHYRR